MGRKNQEENLDKLTTCTANCVSVSLCILFDYVSIFQMKKTCGISLVKPLSIFCDPLCKKNSKKIINRENMIECVNK